MLLLWFCRLVEILGSEACSVSMWRIPCRERWDVSQRCWDRLRSRVPSTSGLPFLVSQTGRPPNYLSPVVKLMAQLIDSPGTETAAKPFPVNAASVPNVYRTFALRCFVGKQSWEWLYTYLRVLVGCGLLSRVYGPTVRHRLQLTKKVKLIYQRLAWREWPYKIKYYFTCDGNRIQAAWRIQTETLPTAPRPLQFCC